MRVLILTPTAFPVVSGNAVTAERWRRALTSKGVEAAVLSAEQLDPQRFWRYLYDFQPEIIHAHHAFRAGALLAGNRPGIEQAGLTVVTSPGGTDLNQDFAVPGRRETILQVFEMAQIIITQSPEIVQRFNDHLASFADRIAFVPKGVCWFGNEPYDLRGVTASNPGQILFLLPSGVRPVKGNVECLELMKQVHSARPNVLFVAAGPAVDREYSIQFEAKLRDCGFARWINIPPASMRSAYEASDVVLNASFSEGLSNSIIEAIAAGRPILASDIPGNRWLVAGQDGTDPAGLLFRIGDHDDFVRKAVQVIDDDASREAFRKAALVRQSRWPSLEDEANGLIAAYKKALQRAAR